MRARISPAARRRAQELDVPIDALGHSAAGGIIHIGDVERWAAQRPRSTAEAPRSEAPQAPIAAAIDTRSAMRTAIGHAMARSKREIPHYYLAHEIDLAARRAG